MKRYISEYCCAVKKQQAAEATCCFFYISSSNDPHAQDIVHCKYALRDICPYALAEVNERVGVFSARLIYHVLDVYIALADKIEYAREHTRHIPVYDAETADSHAAERGVRQIDGVFDIAVFEIVI